MQDEKREMEAKSGRTEGWLLTGHLAQACFCLGEGRREGEIAAISTWPSTCLTGKLTHTNSNSNKHMHVYNHIHMQKCTRFVCEQAPGERRETVWRWTTWPAGCWHVRDQRRVFRLWAIMVTGASFASAHTDEDKHMCTQLKTKTRKHVCLHTHILFSLLYAAHRHTCTHI